MTLDEALRELREMFPKAFFNLEYTARCDQSGKVKERGMINIGGSYFYGPTLDDCILQLRKWKESQS